MRLKWDGNEPRFVVFCTEDQLEKASYSKTEFAIASTHPENIEHHLKYLLDLYTNLTV